MKKYERPIVVVNEELAEGVYANSGAGMEGCYVLQGPWGTTLRTETGYKLGVQIDYVWGTHDHTATNIEVTITLAPGCSVTQWEKVLLNDSRATTILSSSTNSVTVSIPGTSAEGTGNSTACFSLLLYVVADSEPSVGSVSISCFH